MLKKKLNNVHAYPFHKIFLLIFNQNFTPHERNSPDTYKKSLGIHSEPISLVVMHWTTECPKSLELIGIYVNFFIYRIKLKVHILEMALTLDETDTINVSIWSQSIHRNSDYSVQLYDTFRRIRRRAQKPKYDAILYQDTAYRI
jgi:hypothetical protein